MAWTCEEPYAWMAAKWTMLFDNGLIRWESAFRVALILHVDRKASYLSKGKT